MLSSSRRGACRVPSFASGALCPVVNFRPADGSYYKLTNKLLDSSKNIVYMLKNNFTKAENLLRGVDNFRIILKIKK